MRARPISISVMHPIKPSSANEHPLFDARWKACTLGTGPKKQPRAGKSQPMAFTGQF